MDELVPSEVRVINKFIVRLENPVWEPVMAHEQQGALDRVEFVRIRRQGQQGDVVRYLQGF